MKIGAFTAVAISPLVASALSPFRLHPIADGPAHQPTRGSSNAAVVGDRVIHFYSCCEGKIFHLPRCLVAAINTDDATVLYLIAFE
jgi:hypothetical protein